MIRSTFIRILALSALVIGVTGVGGCTDERVRPCVFGPRGWYPADAETLAESVDTFLEGVPSAEESNQPIRAVIVPHAGHKFSGHTAAFAYRLLQGQSIQRVIMLGPSHTADFTGASIPDVDAYETPLGKVLLDRSVCDALLASDSIQTVAEAHLEEHCLEIQLPFLQTVLPEAKIVPILIGARFSAEDCVEIASRIQPFLDDETLLLVSSDFTHQGRNYGYIPYSERTPASEIPAIIRSIDFRAVNDILTLNVVGFWRFVDQNRVTICGRNAIKILLSVLPAQTEAGVLHYETSGDILRDYSSSVSYCAIVFRENQTYLNENEEKTLLEIARKRLQDAFSGKSVPDYHPDETRLTERLREPKGVFVTLNKHEQLRGCIGILEPKMPLHEAVADRVLQSAFHDYRFKPLEKEELDDIDIEISVMTPLKPVKSSTDIVLGRDGMTVEKNGRSAIYLPQVALAQGWGIEETLSHLCVKAGLSADDWKEECAFKTFQAQVFGESFKRLEDL